MADDPKALRPESRMMSAGYDPFLSEGAAKPPIFMTSTFVFRSAEEGEQYFRWAYGLEQRRHDQSMGLIYSRLNNPSLQILEERLGIWDGAEGALSFASGMAAITTSILAHLKPGDLVLYSMPVYGGTDFFFEHILPKFGISTEAFPCDLPLAEIEASGKRRQDRLALLYLESPANPTNVMIDIAGVAAIAKRLSTPSRRVLTFVDNTFLGPIFQRPLDQGADLSLYSATKYLGGHSDVIAGSVCGRKEILEPISVYRTMLGGVPDPFSCWLLLRSLETLRLRMEAQTRNAERVAIALSRSPHVERVLYPALFPEGSMQRSIFEKQCTGPGAMVSFEIKGGKEAAFRFLNSVKLCKLAVSLGGTESLVEHPASMTHSDVAPEIQARFGISPSLVRLSVGVEDAGDLIDDLDQALELSQLPAPNRAVL